MLKYFLFIILILQINSITNKKLNKLWNDAETKDLITSTKSLKLLFSNKEDINSPERFNKLKQRISLLLTQELSKAENLSNKKQFNQSNLIYKNILLYLNDLIDSNNLKYISDQLVETTFRLALGGHVEWNELEKVLNNTPNRSPYQDYLIRMSQKNTENKNANWKPKKNTYKKSDTLPYVLRYFTPQKYHTPTLAHFGHVSLFNFIYFLFNFIYFF